MRKMLSTALLALTILISTAPAAQAAQGNANMPVAGCPKGFTPMTMEEDHDMMDHMHAGIQASLNSDSVLCMREATDTIHVHMDNVVP